MEQIKAKLTEEIELEIDALEQISIGTDEYKTTVDGLAKLVDKALELEKIENERIDKELTRDIAEAERYSKLEAQNKEYELKIKQFESENRDRKVRNGLTAAGIIIPAAVTVWGTLKSFAFDSDGKILTSTLGRGWIQKLLPKK